jgi:hypothetical protein
VQVNFQDGSSSRVKLPVETWLSKAEYTFTLDSKQPILSVVLDPDHVVPDNDRSNDVWKK